MARRLLAGLFAVLGLNSAQASELKPGDPAPAFALADQAGKTHTLTDYRGQWLVLYFYPKDDTPGCTTEACNFRDDISRITALGARVVGVSLDDRASHAKFSEKFRLPFPLLADTDGSVARTYGSLTSLGFVKFAKRHSFIIRPDGTIAKIYRDVNPDTHSRDIQKELKALQSTKPGPEPRL
jgi:peroxiredoxin Q/BCP